MSPKGALLVDMVKTDYQNDLLPVGMDVVLFPTVTVTHEQADGITQSGGKR